MDSTTLAMLNQSADITPLTDAAGKGLQLAQQSEQLQQQKNQAEMQKQQINTAKLDGALGAFKTYSNLSPQAQKNFEPAFDGQFKNYGFDNWKALADIGNSDPILKNKINVLLADPGYLKSRGLDMETLNTVAADPINGMQKIDSLFEDKIKAAGDKQKGQMEIEKAQAGATMRLEGIKYTADKRAETASIGNDIKLDKVEQNALDKITKDKMVVNYSTVLNKLNQDANILETAKTKGLTPLKAQEIVQSYVSALKGQAASSTGTEREHLSSVADDLATKAAAFKQKWGTATGLVKYQDDPLIKDLLDSVGEIRGEISNSLEQRSKVLARSSKLPSVNNVTEKARQTLLDQYKPAKQEIPPAASSTPSAPPPQGQAPAAPSAPSSAAEAQTAFSGKFSPEQIQAYIKAKGLK